MNTGRFTYQIKTMGCKANIFDSLILERQLQELGGIANNAVEPLTSTTCNEVFIVNSCTVTEQADKQTHKEVERFLKQSAQNTDNASARPLTIVTGCYAEVGQDKLAADKNIDWVLPNQQKAQLQKKLAQHFGIDFVESAQVDPDIYWGQLPLNLGKTRAFLKIQEGCNDFCTYCIIPYARGKSRSISMSALVDEVNRLVEAGVQEVVLTGTNIADYGIDASLESKTTLEDLIEAILVKTKLKRLRLTSLDPSEISDRLIELIKSNSTSDSALMPHFHVSLQSPVSRVLRAMKRHYRTEDVVNTLNKIHQANSTIFVGMDLIAGFPSETIEEHNEAFRILSDLPWTRLHVFPYSERKATPALKIKPAVPHSERKRRARQFLELSHKRHHEFVSSFFNKTVDDVLFETIQTAGLDTFIVGHTPNYMRVICPIQSKEQAQTYLNQSCRVRIKTASPYPAQDWTLEGQLENTV